MLNRNDNRLIANPTSILDALSTEQKFHALLQAIHAEVLGLPRERSCYATIDISVNGPLRSGFPEGIVYLAPDRSDVLPLLNRVREACKLLAHPADQAFLLYSAIQLIHPWEDGNGRVGRYIYETLNGRASFDPADIRNSVRQCPYTVEGMKLVGVPFVGATVYLLRRLGTFRESFGDNAALQIMGIDFTSIDSSDLNSKTLLVAAHSQLLRRATTSAMIAKQNSDFLLHAVGSGEGFAPFKIALLESLFPNRILHPLPYMNIRPYDRTGYVIEFPDIGNVISELSVEESIKILNRSWELTNNLVTHLMGAFLAPNSYPVTLGNDGTTIISFKNILMGRM